MLRLLRRVSLCEQLLAATLIEQRSFLKLALRLDKLMNEEVLGLLSALFIYILNEYVNKGVFIGC